MRRKTPQLSSKRSSRRTSRRKSRYTDEEPVMEQSSVEQNDRQTGFHIGGDRILDFIENPPEECQDKQMWELFLALVLRKRIVLKRGHKTFFDPQKHQVSNDDFGMQDQTPIVNNRPILERRPVDASAGTVRVRKHSVNSSHISHQLHRRSHRERPIWKGVALSGFKRVLCQEECSSANRAPVLPCKHRTRNKK